MARRRSGSKWRVRLELSERLRQRVEALRKPTEGDSVAGVMGRALELYEAVVISTQCRKARIFIREKDGTERELLVV